MTDADLPLLIEPAALEAMLGRPGLRIIDLSRSEVHRQYHIPGAIPLDYSQIVRMQPPVGGLLPLPGQLESLFSALGLSHETHIIAYDDEGGGKACRLLWTLDALGHRHYSLLNGGLHAWANEGHPLTAEPTAVTASHYTMAHQNSDAVADRDYILAHLDDPAVALLDARSTAEFSGEKRFAARGGHIPGAINIDWAEFMDNGRNLRLKSTTELHAMLGQAGVTPAQTVVAYCQTHHRSAHTWFALKWLGYRAKGYAGSWSEWGNREDTPIEQ